MPRLILFGGAPTTAELLADWGESDVQHYEFETVPLQQQQAQPEPLPAAAALSQEEQDAIEDSYECSQRDILPQELQYPGTSHQPQKQQEQCLKPISALRVPSINNASRILPRPSLPHAPSELSVLSAGSSSHVEDSYAATLSHAADPAAGLRLPDFRFNPDRITSLANCLAHWQQRQAPGSSGAAHLGSGIDILGFVAAVEPLRTLEVRNRGGQQSARLFKMELCDESVNRQAVGKLRVSAWDHVAESLAQEIQKGDVVWLSNVGLTFNRYEKAVCGTATRQTLCQVCYRTSLQFSLPASISGLGDAQHLQPNVALAAEYQHKPSIKVLDILQWAAQSGLLLPET